MSTTITTDDPRHGTVWAYSTAECRCQTCSAAHRRRCKDWQFRSHQLGGSTTVDAAPAAVILAAAAERMSMSAIGRHLGTSHTWVGKVIRGDIKRIAVDRAAAITTLRNHFPTDTSHVAAIGTTRRLQALHCLGYTWPALCTETGYSLSGIKSVVHGHWAVVEAANATAVRDAYDRLSMTLPVGTTPHQRGAITSARNDSRRYGWAPPLAWWDIDDPNESPTSEPADTEIDEVAVQRILSGDGTVPATTAERVEVVARWRASGRPLNHLEQLTGWKADRYYTADDSEQVAS